MLPNKELNFVDVLILIKLKLFIRLHRKKLVFKHLLFDEPKLVVNLLNLIQYFIISILLCDFHLG